MAKGSFVKFLVNRDVFGQPISVQYKGSSSYKTKVGALCTIIITVIMIINTAILVQGYTSQSQQKETSKTIFYDRFKAGKFYLKENSVNFRILSYSPEPIPATVGRWYVMQRKYD